MSQNTTTFETGATSPVVNSLILFTDNTAPLAAMRDEIYERCSFRGHVPRPAAFHTLVAVAESQYYRETDEYICLSVEEIIEYCVLYASGYHDWKKEHGK